MTLRLGKKEAQHDPRTLKLSAYLKPELPAPPDSVDWTVGVGDWGLYGNDRLGDCVVAGCAHMIGCWTRWAAGTPSWVPLSDVVSTYLELSPNDEGLVVLDFLKRWRKPGVLGHPIGAFVSVDPNSTWQLMQAITYFGGVYLGVQLPISAQGQDTWTVTDPGLRGAAAPGSWGGHCVTVQAFDASGLTCVTWGKTKRLSWGFWSAYCDEAFALASVDWVCSDSQESPTGLDMAALVSDLQAVTA